MAGQVTGRCAADLGRSGGFAASGVPDLRGTRWRVSFDAPLNTGPLLAGGLVLAADAAGVVQAVDLADGVPRWRFAAGCEVSGTLDVADGLVAFGGADGLVRLVALDDGELVWQGGDPDRGSAHHPTLVDDLLVYQTSGDDLLVYQTSGDDLVAVRPSVSSDPVWTRPDVYSSDTCAAFDADRVYVSEQVEGNDAHGGLHAIDLRSGALRWSAEEVAYLAPSHPVVIDDRVYVVGEVDTGDDFEFLLFGFDAATGAAVCRHPLTEPGMPVLDTGCVTSGVWCYRTPEAVYGLDLATGQQVLRASGVFDAAVVDSGNNGAPVTAAGVLYLVDAQGRVHAIQAGDGGHLWSHATGGTPPTGDDGPYPAVQVGDGIVVVATGTDLTALH